jgi:hypothetical protein
MLQSATDPNLAIKQLRYFARFIIICLLLNRREVRRQRQKQSHILETGTCQQALKQHRAWCQGTASKHTSAAACLAGEAMCTSQQL